MLHDSSAAPVLVGSSSPSSLKHRAGARHKGEVFFDTFRSGQPTDGHWTAYLAPIHISQLICASMASIIFPLLLFRRRREETTV